MAHKRKKYLYLLAVVLVLGVVMILNEILTLFFLSDRIKVLVAAIAVYVFNGLAYRLLKIKRNK